MVLNLESKHDLEDFKTYILVEKNFSEQGDRKRRGAL